MATLSVKLSKFNSLLNSLKVTRSISTTCLLQVDRTSSRRNAQAQSVQNDSNVVIPPPNLDGQNKVYAPKIANLVSEISKLTLIEVADLNELLRKTLNIKDMPAYAPAPSGDAAKQASAAAAAAKSEENDQPQAQVTQKSSFKLKIVKYDEAKKVALIKEVKALSENMNLVQAKKLIESLPQVFRDNVAKDEAEKVKAQLEKSGATCVIE